MKKIKKITVTVIASLLLNVGTYMPVDAFAYNDISGSKAKPYIDYLISKGIVFDNGTAKFSPEQKVSNVELFTTVLKAQSYMKGESVETLVDTNSIMSKATEKGLVKSNEGLSKATSSPTVEQVAMVLYRVIKDKERLPDYFGQYDYPLDHTISDYNQISPYYRPGVAVCFANGIMSWTEKTKKTDRWGVRYIYPKNNVTRAEMCTMIAKLVDKNKRVSDISISNLKQSKYITLLLPTESKTPKYLPFANGRPVFDREKDLIDLWNTNKSSLTKSFNNSLRHDDLINHEWALKQDLEYKIKDVNDRYESTYKFIEKLFNASYKNDLIQYEKDLRYYVPYADYVNNYVNQHLKMIREQKLSIEGIVVTDPQMLYTASDSSTRTKMRLYFKISSTVTKTVKVQQRMFFPTFGDVALKTNQWYQYDFEGESASGYGFDHLKDKWIAGEYTYFETYNLSNFIPINEKK